jgi:hypothetical protein
MGFFYCKQYYIFDYINLCIYICDMKSNVILQSTDRSLFDITIRQNTKEQFLSVTDLQKAFEKARWQFGWSDRRVNDILSGQDVKLRIYYLLKERNIIKAEIPVFMEMIDKEGITKVLKGLGQWKTTGRGENKQVMADPYLWMLLALELNPMIYAKVVVWLADTLIFDRIEAGSEWKPMNSAISGIIKLPNYPLYAKEINKKVFGQHISGMRNLASSKELRKIADIEKMVIKAIENKWIANESQLLEFIQGF